MDEWFVEHGGLLLWGAIAGAAVTAALGYIFYRLTIRTPKVDWLPKGASSILAIEEDQRENLKDLKVLWGGVEKRNPNLVLLRIANTSSSAVTKESFDPGIHFDFAKTELLRATIVKQSNPDATIAVKDIADHGCGIELSSLGSGHWFDVQFITNNESADYPEVKGSVIGRRPNGRLNKLTVPVKSSTVGQRIAVAGFGGFIVGVIIFSILGIKPYDGPKGILAAVLIFTLLAAFLLGAALMAWGSYREYRIKRIMRG